MQTAEPRVCIHCILVGHRKQIDSVVILREQMGISLGARKNGNATGRGRQDEVCVLGSRTLAKRQNLARHRPLLDMGWRHTGSPVRLRTWKRE